MYQEKSATASILTSSLLITFIFMEATTIVISLIAVILWALTFGIMAYRNLKEAQEIEARTELLKQHRDNESFALKQYEKLLQQRNDILAGSNEDLKSRVSRMNDEALAKKKRVSKK